MNMRERLQTAYMVLLVTFAGCIMAGSHMDTTPQATNTRIAEKTASHMDWLIICGAVTTAFGVAAFIAGQTRGITIAAAGVVLTSIGMLITFILTTLIEYRNYFAIGFILLLILGFFTFFRSVADVNKDGKIDCEDLKALFFKTKRL